MKKIRGREHEITCKNDDDFAEIGRASCRERVLLIV